VGSAAYRAHVSCGRIDVGPSMKRATILRTLCHLTAFLLLSGALGCSDQPFFLSYRRPANVPADAVVVYLAKTGVWQRCSFDSSDNQNRCQIYNWKGNLLLDEVFLAYDGRGPVSTGELKIPHHAPRAGPYWVNLGNGRILIPKSRSIKLSANSIAPQSTRQTRNRSDI
jgi:hypothetical protein